MLNIYKKILFLVSAILFMHFYIYPLEVSDGKIKLILHEDIGRFSLYYLSDAENGKYTSLFTDQDPRTTTFSLVINNKVYRLGDSLSFKETSEKTSNGAKFSWKSNQMEITQEFAFIKSITSTESDGINISTTISNISETEIEVGARFIIDTNLGESTATHFKTASEAKITKETKIEASEMLDYWVSPKDDITGLMVVTNGIGITNPDIVIFANWKRLNDTSWSYTASSSRNFSLPPYSINDSAACHYYFPQKISSGLSMEIVTIMGNYTDAGFLLKKTSSTSKTTTTSSSTTTTKSSDTNLSKTTTSVTKKDTSNTESSNNSPLTNSIKGDISTLETVLEEINNKISSGNFTVKDLELLEKIILELKNKTDNYNQN